MSVSVQAGVPAGAEPITRITPFEDTIGIPVVEFISGVQIQFRPHDPEGTIRYLRQLAAVATDLADLVEHKAAEAVLSA